METENSIALGIGIETGGHIFQLIFTNSRAMIEKGFIADEIKKLDADFWDSMKDENL